MKYNPLPLPVEPTENSGEQLPGQMSPAAKRRLTICLQLAVLASIAYCVQFDFTRLFITKAPTRIAQPYALWDGWIADAAAPGKGIFMDFDHVPATAGGYVQNIYYRAVYDLYPRPVYVTDPRLVINDGLAVLNHNESPGDQWLRDHGVDSVMTIEMDKKAKLPKVTNVHWLDE